MRVNKPTTNQQRTFPTGTSLVSITDLKGVIQYVNQDFIEISGFSEEELIGQNHHIVRHPDMPPAAFADLWSNIKSDTAWRGMVKNRCQNGDYYWVDAYVTPVFRGRTKVGYQSVRSCPSREKIQQADALYAKMRSNSAMKLPKQNSFADYSAAAKLSGSSLLLMLLSLLLMFGGESTSTGQYILGGALILGLALQWWGVSAILINPLANLQAVMRKISSGDLTDTIDADNSDEMGTSFMTVKMLQSRLRTIFNQFNESSDALVNAAEVVASASAQTGDGMDKQSSETQQIAAAMNEMVATVNEVANNAGEAAKLAREAQDEAIQGAEVVVNSKLVISDLSDEVEQTSGLINKLAEDSDRISNITETISSIAEQTNLLALNAAIEAARAGEQGRGFAVVADEVRSLASRTQEATAEIRGMIDNLHQGISGAVEAMESSTQRAARAVEEVDVSEQRFGNISTAINHVNDMNTQIATAAEQQSLVSEEMNRNIQNISDVSRDTTESAAHLQQSSLALNEQTQKLLEQLKNVDLGKR